MTCGPLLLGGPQAAEVSHRQGASAANRDEGAGFHGRPLVNLSDADRASVAGRGCAQERSRPVYRLAA